MRGHSQHAPGKGRIAAGARHVRHVVLRLNSSIRSPRIGPTPEDRALDIAANPERYQPVRYGDTLPERLDRNYAYRRPAG
jgi:hypothetical protein